MGTALKVRETQYAPRITGTAAYQRPYLRPQEPIKTHKPRHEDEKLYDPNDIPGSFTRLYDKYRAYTVALVTRKIGPNNAEDVAQDVWGKVLRAMEMETLTFKGNMKTYLYRCI